MTKPKTLEQLRTEKERAETQLAQEQHKLERLENRKKYLEKGERQKRTHRLCNLGGTVESLAPEVKDLTRTEMTELIRTCWGWTRTTQRWKTSWRRRWQTSKAPIPAMTSTAIRWTRSAITPMSWRPISRQSTMSISGNRCRTNCEKSLRHSMS